jgi:AraC-like DNA-binding protein
MIRIQHVVKKIKENKSEKISNIVYGCGFSSLPTFYRSFKKIYGVSPKEELGI